MNTTLFSRSGFALILFFTVTFLNGQEWSSMGSTNDIVNVFSEYNGKVVMGGRFGTVNGKTVKSLAIWEQDFNNQWGWEEFAQISGWIYDMTVYNGEFYIAGDFVYVNQDPMIKIAKYNGSWSKVGNNGVNGTLTQGSTAGVYAMAVYQGELYAGGTFTAAAGVPMTNNIAKWNGSTWSSVGGGIVAQQYAGVRELYVYNGELYAAGSFSIAGGVSVKNIAKWDGSNWSVVADFGATSLGNATILDFAEYNGELYAAGDFSVVNGSPANRIAKFDGVSWQDASAGMSASIRVSAVCVYEDDLYAAGNFNISGSSQSSNFARWGGTTWLGEGPVSGGNIQTLAAIDGKLYAGGLFNMIEGVSCGNLATYAPPNLVGITELAENKLSVSPNPFSTETVMHSPRDLGQTTIQIYNTAGQLVKSYKDFTGNTLRIQREEMAAGIYMLRVTFPDRTVRTQKLIVLEEN